MSISMEEAAKRIIICAVDDVNIAISRHNVGFIFNTRAYNETGYCRILNLPFRYPTIKDLNDATARNEMKNSLNTAQLFLEENSNEHLLVHCTAGFHGSPSFVLMLLLQLQEGVQDIPLAIRTLKKIKPDADITSIYDCSPYLDIDIEILKKIAIDYFYIKQLHYALNKGKSIKEAVANVWQNEGKPPSLGKIFQLSKDYGFYFSKDTAPCDASNDQPKPPPSSPHTRACP